ncbi:MAG: ABC transporter substrate-binding protein [Propionibacteriaceae bacterium]|nr:ABC transporter substrate-binding protein [Propionibacteriaceae bacterium]
MVADVGYGDGQVSVACHSISCLIFEDLGLTISPAADADGDGKPDSEGNLYSLEQLGQLSDIDVIFTGVFEDGSGPLDDESLTNNELWKSLPAVANNRIFGYNYEMFAGSPSGQDALLKVIEEALLEN